MTCLALDNREVFRSYLCRYCHPEEALSAVPGLPAAQYAAQAGTGRRQADEGSTAAWLDPWAYGTEPDLAGGTSAHSASSLRMTIWAMYIRGGYIRRMSESTWRYH